MPLVLWKTALISPPCATTFDMPQLRRHRSTFTATTSSAQSKSARLLMRLLGKTNPVGGAVLFYARILTLGQLVRGLARASTRHRPVAPDLLGGGLPGDVGRVHRMVHLAAASRAPAVGVDGGPALVSCLARGPRGRWR